MTAKHHKITSVDIEYAVSPQDYCDNCRDTYCKSHGSIICEGLLENNAAWSAKQKNVEEAACAKSSK